MNAFPVVNIGDKLLVDWITVASEHEDHKNDLKRSNSLQTHQVLVLNIFKKNKPKNGSYFVYELRFLSDDTSDTQQVIRKTRLLHLKWKLLSNDSDSNKKRRLDLEVLKETKFNVLNHIQYILAPMVGGSELPFRLLCRKYGATLAYTPMIQSGKFSVDEHYRREQFQCFGPQDRPLVVHFAANDPEVLLKAAKLVEHQCDAIDINLGMTSTIPRPYPHVCGYMIGCPQRIAFTGHFGSYLLDEVDWPLICRMVKTLSMSLSIPVFVKIRLLEALSDTIRLCERLIQSGASLIAIHARYRVNLVGIT